MNNIFKNGFYPLSGRKMNRERSSSPEAQWNSLARTLRRLPRDDPIRSCTSSTLYSSPPSLPPPETPPSEANFAASSSASDGRGAITADIVRFHFLRELSRSMKRARSEIVPYRSDRSGNPRSSPSPPRSRSIEIERKRERRRESWGSSTEGEVKRLSSKGVDL